MTYYEDLSLYKYTKSEAPMLNVGWLAAGHDFPTGDVEARFVQNLLRLAEHQENVMRGVHDCDFCDRESPMRVVAQVERGWVSLGMGEIHVAGVDGEVYAAPSLVAHYVEAHRYRPPARFVEAVDSAVHRGGP